MGKIFVKIKRSDVEFAKGLVKLAFPKLKYVGTMKRTGEDVFWFGQYKIMLGFPKNNLESYWVRTISVNDRWVYQIELCQGSDDEWTDVKEVIKWVHPDTLEVYDDPQILRDEYKTLPYMHELHERHPMR